MLHKCSRLINKNCENRGKCTNGTDTEQTTGETTAKIKHKQQQKKAKKSKCSQQQQQQYSGFRTRLTMTMA